MQFESKQQLGEFKADKSTKICTEIHITENFLEKM